MARFNLVGSAILGCLITLYGHLVFKQFSHLLDKGGFPLMEKLTLLVLTTLTLLFSSWGLPSLWDQSVHTNVFATTSETETSGNMG